MKKTCGHEDVSDLVALISERGRIVNNLVINEEYTIISGHRRWLAAKELNYSTVPCEIVSFDSVEDSDDDDNPKGATRDVVAKKAGLSSGKTYNRGKNVILAVDRLKDSGNHDDAQLLILMLTKMSIGGGGLSKD